MKNIHRHEHAKVDRLGEAQPVDLCMLMFSE